jgi:hypothetical protein
VLAGRTQKTLLAEVTFIGARGLALWGVTLDMDEKKQPLPGDSRKTKRRP